MDVGDGRFAVFWRKKNATGRLVFWAERGREVMVSPIQVLS
jgi:hypothetical protein